MAGATPEGMGETSNVSYRRTRKSDETRQRILDSALDLFRERGFEATTMRDIAAHCGIALGATYYHFSSKEAIVLAFYEVAKEELREPLEHEAAGIQDLAGGLRAILHVKFSYFAPNRKFLGALFPHAADPRDPLSPFSDQNRHIRVADANYFQTVMDRVGFRVPDDLALHVPQLLWLYQMALILFWIYDRSPEQQRTRLLTDKSIVIVVKLLELSRLPFAKPLRSMVVDLLETVVTHH